MASPAVRKIFEDFIGQARSTLAVPGTKPEASVYGPFRQLVESLLAHLSPKAAWSVVEQANADSLGIPDYRIGKGKELHGWIELKAVVGKDLSGLAGHDKNQFERFSSGLGNFIISNGWDWRLYRDGKQVGKKVALGDDHLLDPKKLSWAVSDAELDALVALVDQFVNAPLFNYTTAEQAVEALASRARAINLALVERP